MRNPGHVADKKMSFTSPPGSVDSTPSGEITGMSSDQQSNHQPDSCGNALRRLQRRTTASADALRTLIRDLYTAQFGAHLPADPEFDLQISLRVSPQEDWSVVFNPPLPEQVIEQLSNEQAGRGYYVPGRVHCFRCLSSNCEHATPENPLQVFKGYSSLGTPEWHELTQVLVNTAHPRIDELFGERPRVLACVQTGSELREQQLNAFGKSSRTYSILGQVATGYLRTPHRHRLHATLDRAAVTLQVVESRTPDGCFALKLNAIASDLSEDEWMELLQQDWEIPVGTAVSRARAELESIEKDVRAAFEAGGYKASRPMMQRIPRLLRSLARYLEQSHRQSGRRTQHVMQRRRERPIHKAIDDASAAPQTAWFYDERHGTWVVRGAQNRAHVFTGDGRHVTTFKIKEGSTEFRLRTHRWRPATAEEIAPICAGINDARHSGPQGHQAQAMPRKPRPAAQQNDRQDE